MLTWLVSTSLRLRVVVLALSAVMLVAGFRADQRTPLDGFWDVSEHTGRIDVEFGQLLPRALQIEARGHIDDVDFNMRIANEAVPHAADFSDELGGRKLLEIRDRFKPQLGQEIWQKVFPEFAFDPIGIAQEPPSRERADHQCTPFFLTLINVQPAADRHQIFRTFGNLVTKAKAPGG